jgi:hypothetical protein
MKKKYEDYVQECQEGKISLVEFISTQPDMKKKFCAYLEATKLEADEDSACLFITKYEEYIMQLL